MGYLNPKSLQGLREKSLAQKFTKDYDVFLDVVRVLAPSHHMLPEMTSYFIGKTEEGNPWLVYNSNIDGQPGRTARHWH